MPKISQRGQAMPASPIRRLVPFAEQAKSKGIKVYHLNIGQPDIKTPDTMLNAVKNAQLSVIEYSHSAGNESYRRRLAADYYGKQCGIANITHQDIIVTTGGSEALYFALFSCLDPGDEIIIPEPLYANYNGFSSAGNIVVCPITANIDNGFALPSMEAFKANITPRTKAILICNPNNPTGYLYSVEELQQLRDIALRHDLFLFVDEVYREFVYDGATATSILSLPDLEQHAVVIDSVSKRYSACGVRIGALVSRNKELIATALKFGQARLSPPTYGQIAAEAAIDTPQEYMNEVLTEYTHRRNVLVEGLRRLPGVVCPMPRGAFYVTAQLPIADADHFCQWLLSDFSYNNATVMLAPATGFYATAGLGKQEVRLAYVLNETDLRAALLCLEHALAAYPNRI